MNIANDISASNTEASYRYKEFEKLYIYCREKEQRIYTDEQLAKLPYIGPSHIHYKEWLLRKRSADRFTQYLRYKNRPLSILEIGCGNGWLCNVLSDLPGSTVTGTDINVTELNQARKVFEHKRNIKFLQGDIRQIEISHQFDIIVFAASIQYFPSFKKIIQYVLPLLKEHGEVHVIDSHFYKGTDIIPAMRRTVEWYRCMGCEEMAAWYFHHSTETLADFNYCLLFDPSVVRNKILKRKDIFPWICIQKS